MIDTRRKWRIDDGLPINGRGADRRVAGNMWGCEAAQVASETGAGIAIPCHYDMFEFNTAAPDEFVAACEALKQPFGVLRAANRSRWLFRPQNQIEGA